MKKTEGHTENVYPKFLDNKPCGQDLFHGGAHTNIANKIAQIVQSKNGIQIIGLDGCWGSGKSNIIEIIKDKLNPRQFRIFIYDAWGHKEDFKRRSILEELTTFLTGKYVHNQKEYDSILIGENWEKDKQALLGIKRETETISMPKLSLGIIISVLAIILTPILELLSTEIENIYGKVFVMLIPILALLFLLIVNFVKHLTNKDKKGNTCSFTDTIAESFSVYAGKKQELKTIENISEIEPSSTQFKNWMSKIDESIQDCKLIIVFDNMDRLPKVEVQELWAAIHSFFAEINYNNIVVIVPFDRNHIYTAFESENIDLEDKSSQAEDANNHKQVCKKYYGDDFINKTFDVIYRVSPPIMSDWKNYFATRWENAMGEKLKEDSRILQIYDISVENPTPREIIAFINEFVAIKQIADINIPNEYIALFIFIKTSIQANPFVEIIEPKLKHELKTLFIADNNLPQYLSALYYQLPVKDALDIVYTERLIKALNNNKFDEVKQICTLSIFNDLLEKALLKVTNYPNAILALNKCQNVRVKHWNYIYKQINKQEDILQEYQKILLTKISTSQKDTYLKRIIQEFFTAQTFDAIKYHESIGQLATIEGIDPYKYVQAKEIEPKNFLTYVEYAKQDYKTCRITCKKEKLDEYLGSLPIDQLANMSAIPFIIAEYKELSKYQENLESHIGLTPPEKDNITTIYTRLKEIQRPIKKRLNDSHITTIFKQCIDSEDIYCDLLCMRISRLSNFNSQLTAYYNTALLKTDNDFVERIVKTIEFYMNYGDIVLNYQFYRQWPLLKAIAVKLTQENNASSIADLKLILPKYEEIKNALEVDTSIIIKRLDTFENRHLTMQDVINIPISFFEDTIENKEGLVSYCRNLYWEHLKTITKEQWEVEIVKKTKNYKIVSLLRLDVLNCWEAFKSLLEKTADGSINNFSKEDKDDLLLLVEQYNSPLENTYRNIRDMFCSGRQVMSEKLFIFFAEQLLKYGKLEERADTLRTIFKPDFLQNKSIVETILNHAEIVRILVENAAEENKEFKLKIQDLLKTGYREEDQFIAFAHSIGVFAPESE